MEHLPTQTVKTFLQLYQSQWKKSVVGAKNAKREVSVQVQVS